MDLHQEKKRKLDSSSASLSSSIIPYGKYIEENVMIEILIRLPGKSISRFKCVSKLWLSLLSNPTFISRRLMHASNIPRCIFFYNFQLPLNLKNPTTYPNIYSSGKFTADNAGFLFKFIISKLSLLQQGLPECHTVKQKDELYLLGSSNGLVLCENSNMCPQTVYLVGNPVTGECSHVPPPPLGRRHWSQKTGFISESSSSNSLNSKQTSYYKVVHIPFLSHLSPVTEFEIDLYSSDTGSWKVFKVLCPREVTTNNMSETIKTSSIASHNEVLYWIVTDDQPNVQILLAYDLKQNTGVPSRPCRLIELPELAHFGDQRCLGKTGRFISYSHCSEGILKVWSLEDDTTTGLCKWNLTQKADLKDMIFEEDTLGCKGFDRSDMYRTAPVAFQPEDQNVMFIVVRFSVFMYNFETKILRKLGRDLTGTKHLPFVLIPSLQTLY